MLNELEGKNFFLSKWMFNTRTTKKRVWFQRKFLVDWRRKIAFVFSQLWKALEKTHAYIYDGAEEVFCFRPCNMRAFHRMRGVGLGLFELPHAQTSSFLKCFAIFIGTDTSNSKNNFSNTTVLVGGLIKKEAYEEFKQKQEKFFVTVIETRN